MNLHFSAFIIIELLPDGRLDKTAIWLNMNSERKRDNILLKNYINLKELHMFNI